MTKKIIVLITLFLLCNFTGCSSDIKEEARYIKHSDIVNNFDTFNGELIKIDGIVFLTDDYKKGDDITVLNVTDGEYHINYITNNVKYNPYNGEYITAYGKITGISQETFFYESKAIQIDSQIIEQTKVPAEELKNDVFIKEYIKNN